VIHLSPASLRPREIYDLLTSLIVPRAIAWVSTRDSSGHTNLAPFSYFTGLGSDPPMITIGIANRRDGARKDTLRLAKETGVMCVNLVEEHDASRMNASSGEVPADVSEIDLLGIETEECHSIPCVRVKSSRAALECKLVDVHEYGNKVRVNLVVAEVIHFAIADELNDVDSRANAIHPVARLQGSWYAKLGDRFQLERPK
jgi:flavin reductase (DIM6/NTAB) family NADH-FMN oxidoreductase RutF